MLGKCCLFIIVLSPLLAFAPLGSAEQKAAPGLPVKAGVRDHEKFWWKPDRQRAAAAAEMVLIRQPLTIAAMRWHGKTNLVWGEEEFASPTALPLNARWLEEVNDGGFQDYRKDEKWRSVPFWELPDEYKVFCEALVKANDTPVDAFQESAKRNSDAQFAQMYAAPAQWRGAVVEISGRLRRLRRYDAPLLAREDGVKYVYEGWIFPDTKGTPPVCVVFTRLPDKVPVAENLDAHVSFYGYFFKRYKYVSGEQQVDKEGAVHNRQRDTLLLVGPTLLVNSTVSLPAAQESWAAVIYLVIIVVGVCVAVVILVVVMSMFYRRADARVRKQISDIRAAKDNFFQDEAPPDGNGLANRLSGGNLQDKNDS